MKNSKIIKSISKNFGADKKREKLYGVTVSLGKILATDATKLIEYTHPEIIDGKDGFYNAENIKEVPEKYELDKPGDENFPKNYDSFFIPEIASKYFDCEEIQKVSDTLSLITKGIKSHRVKIAITDSSLQFSVDGIARGILMGLK